MGKRVVCFHTTQKSCPKAKLIYVFSMWKKVNEIFTLEWAGPCYKWSFKSVYYLIIFNLLFKLLWILGSFIIQSFGAGRDFPKEKWRQEVSGKRRIWTLVWPSLLLEGGRWDLGIKVSLKIMYLIYTHLDGCQSTTPVLEQFAASRDSTFEPRNEFQSNRTFKIFTI